MKNTIFKKAAAILTAAVMAVSAVPVTSFAAMDTSEFEAGYTYPTEMRGLTAFQLVSDMGAGWNLGNSLEADYNETNWGNPKTTKLMIDAIAAKGFTTLRVPVRWDDNYSNPSTYTVNESYMDRVETVVNYGLANDMYVILNVHHNDLQHEVPDTEGISAELSALWTQIGNRFKNYGDKLVFEVNNEPRGYTNGEEDWTGNAEYYECVNQCNEAARAAIRATGGNNAERLVMLPTYCASGDAAKAAAWTKNAGDDMIAASIHAYLPFNFAFSNDTEYGAHSDWLESDLTELEYFFERMDTYFISKGVPVVIGEFGATNKNNTSARETWAEAYISLARRFPEQDIPCVVWDNHYVDTNNPGTEQFKLFDRNSRTFIYDGIAEAFVSGYEGDPDCEIASSGDIIISNASTALSNWSNSAFSADYITGLKAGESVAVQYTGDAPLLILQSWSGGGGWTKIYPDKTSNGIAYFSYETLLSGYGGSFSLLNQAYVSAADGSTTVTKIYIPQIAAHTHNYNGTEKVTLAATATTYGRKTVNCSVSGCEVHCVKLIAPVEEEEKVTVPVISSAVAGDGKVTLTWNAVDGATQYIVKKYVGGAYSNVTTTTSTSCVATGLTGGTKYGFIVQAYVNGAWTPFAAAVSNMVYATPTGGASVPVITSAVAGNGQVTLTWNAVSGATQYIVKKYVGGAYSNVTTTTSTSCVATGLTGGTKYGFIVQAYVNGKWTAFATASANMVYATPTGSSSVPVISSAVAGNSKVTLSWNAVSGATQYIVKKYMNGTYSNVATTTSTSCVATGLTGGIKYGFIVQAYVNGKWTAFATASANMVYATPTGSTVPVIYSAVAGNGKVTLSWNAVDGATQYIVKKYVGGAYSNVTTTTSTSCVATGLTNGTKYGFVVQAYVNGAWTPFATAVANMVYATPAA